MIEIIVFFYWLKLYGKYILRKKRSRLMMEENYFLNNDIKSIAEKIKAGQISSMELVRFSFNKINKENNFVNAFVELNENESYIQAKILDEEAKQGKIRSELHGIPIAIKDNIDTKDLKTTYGSHFYKDFVPNFDASSVDILKKLGAIIIGKTLTSEFALGPTGEFSYQGAASNPYDYSKIAGGSSAGSAIAVAMGMVPFAVGTDTAGSVRIPASYCGTNGFKPTFNLIEMDGIFPISKTLDHIGYFSNHIDDIYLVLDLISSLSCEFNNKSRFKWLDTNNIVECDIRLESELKKYIKTKNYLIEEVVLDKDFADELAANIKVVMLTEAYIVHKNRIENHRDSFSEEQLNRLLLANNYTGWQYAESLQKRKILIEKFEQEYFKNSDFLLMPTTSTQAFDKNSKECNINGNSYDVRLAANGLTGIFNYLGFPSLALNCGFYDGLPLSLQIIGKYNKDLELLNFSKTLKD